MSNKKYMIFPTVLDRSTRFWKVKEAAPIRQIFHRSRAAKYEAIKMGIRFFIVRRVK